MTDIQTDSSEQTEFVYGWYLIDRYCTRYGSVCSVFIEDGWTLGTHASHLRDTAYEVSEVCGCWQMSCL